MSRENKVDRNCGGGPVEPKEQQGECMKDASAAVAWGAWHASGLGGDGDDRHAVVSGEVENHLGGGRCLCSLPPQKPKKSCLKIRVAGEVLPFSLMI